jgi:uncharacterized membrane protein
MPYRWLADTADLPVRLQLWPHRSLTTGGFVGVFALSAAILALPLLSLLGTPALWAVLGFAALILSGLWAALRRSDRDRSITEDLVLTRDSVTLTRRGPRDREQRWEANPAMVQVVVHPGAVPVPNYVTLQGGPREVELGAFLDAEERMALSRELRAALARLR